MRKSGFELSARRLVHPICPLTTCNRPARPNSLPKRPLRNRRARGGLRCPRRLFKDGIKRSALVARHYFTCLIAKLVKMPRSDNHIDLGYDLLVGTRRSARPAWLPKMRVEL
jgi:hypothetical protein